MSRIADRPDAQVLIVGGGINGIATFRDLALQGVDVVLVERADYASGASAASSHMIHGGIRYLENGEFRLVRESVEERNGLLKIAPHYVKPLQTTMPIFSTFSGILNAPLRMLTHKQRSTKERGALLIKVGMTMYDSFSRDGGSVPRHKFLGRKAALAEMPHLNKDLKYTGTYYDASVHEPERLALDVLKDGLAAGDNARSANYLEAAGTADGGVVLRDVVTGTEFTVTADVVVNASGPWTDLTNAALGARVAVHGRHQGLAHRRRQPRAARGHERPRDLLREQRRPHRADLPAEGPRADRHHRPRGRHGRAGGLHRGGGGLLLRPRQARLPADRDHARPHRLPLLGRPPAAAARRHSPPGFVSRDYRIVETEVAEPADQQGAQPRRRQVDDLPRPRRRTCRPRRRTASASTRTVDTTGMAIGGGKDFPTTDAARTTWVAAHADGLSREHVDRLLTRYGTRAESVIEVLLDQPSEPLASDPGLTTAEIAYFAEHEDAVHLADVVLRRTNLAFVGGVTIELLSEIADVLGVEPRLDGRRARGRDRGHPRRAAHLARRRGGVAARAERTPVASTAA